MCCILFVNEMIVVFGLVLMCMYFVICSCVNMECWILLCLWCSCGLCGL